MTSDSKIEPPSWKAWLEHFHAGVLLGLFAICLSAILHGCAPVVALDRVGEDQVQRERMHREPAPKPRHAESVVLLDVNFPRDPPGEETKKLAEIIRALADKSLPRRPRAILVDQMITEFVPIATVTEFAQAVRAASVPVVLVPNMVTEQTQAGSAIRILPGPTEDLRKENLPHIIFASPMLLEDSDGTIRSFANSSCFESPYQDWLALPTFPASVVPSVTGNAALVREHPCGSEGETHPIDYLVSPDKLGKGSALAIVRAEDFLKCDLDCRSKAVGGKLVLIGESAPSDWADVRQTPLGPMPGVLIHANALLSPIEPEFEWRSFLAGAAVYLTLAAASVWLWWPLHRRAKVGHDGPHRNVRFGAIILSLLFGLTAALVLLTGQAFEAAEPAKLSMELAGVLFASASFATQDQIAAYLGRRWRSFADLIWLASFLAAALLVIIGIGVVWLYAGIWLLSFGLRVGSLVPVAATSAEALVKAGQSVTHLLHKLIYKACHATPRLLVLCALALGASGAPLLAAPAEPAPTEPAPSTGASQSYLSAFLGMFRASSGASVPGVGRRFRGDGADALAWLPLVPVDGARLPPTAASLCLAWTGGAPPFLVSLRTESGAGLGAHKSQGRVIEIPGFIMTAEPVLVDVKDAQNQHLAATILPAAAPGDASPDPTQSALALFVQGAPAWRLEAVRRLARLAPANKKAADALDHVRAEAKGPP